MEASKSLQKFTSLETIDSLRDYLGNDPGKAKEVVSKLQDVINESYANELGLEFQAVELAVKCYDLANEPEKSEWLRNVTYECNHTIIGTCIHNHICKHNAFPSVTAIKEETGLSRQTVYAHIKDGFSRELNILVKGKLSYMIPKALEKLYLIGIEDNNAGALKSFIELAGHTKEPETNINNYIQINNLKLSRDEFDQLPEDVILQVEKLILKNQSKARKEEKRI